MGGPAFDVSSTTRSPSSRSKTRTVLVSGLCWSALPARLETTWAMRSGSQFPHASPRASNSMVRSGYASSSSSMTVSHRSRRFMRLVSMGKPPPRRLRVKSSRSAIIRVIRSALATMREAVRAWRSESP